MDEKNSLKNNLQNEINSQLGSVSDTKPVKGDSSSQKKPLDDQPILENNNQKVNISTPNTSIQSEIDSVINEKPENNVPVNANLSNIDPDLQKTSTPSVVTMQSQMKGQPGNKPARPIIPQKPVPEIEVPEKEIPKTPADDYDISTVRTYKADINDTVSTDKITTSKVLIAEQKRQDQEIDKQDNYSISNPKNKFKLGFSVVLISLAIVGILYGTFMYMLPTPKNTQQNVFQQTGSLFAVDNIQYVDTTGKSRESVLNDISIFLGASFKASSVNELVLYQTKLEGSEQIKTKVPISGLLNVLEFNLPTVFGRSLSNKYSFGVYNSKDENLPYVLIEVSDFGNAYDSIFTYEDGIISDMRKIFGGFPEYDLLNELLSENVRAIEESEIPKEEPQTEEQNVSEEGGAQEEVVTDVVEEDSLADDVVELTEEEKLEKIQEEISLLNSKIDKNKNFIDIVLQNSDTRAILGENSEILFYYAFIDRKWLLFSNNPEVLKEIKRRVREKNLSR